MPASFRDRKEKILGELSTPENQYHDLSPKGSVDAGIRDLISEINGLSEYVTTSSCAGRIAVYLEGPKKVKGGGQWLFTSHDPVDLSKICTDGNVYGSFGMEMKSEVSAPSGKVCEARFVHFKFEPMILHILASSLPAAQHAISAALQAGFRESSINGILDTKGQPATPMVAVRSSGLAFDCIIGYKDTSPDDGQIKSMVSEDYLRTLVAVANQRFTVNRERTERFWKALIN